MFCPECGRELPDDSAFCEFCGTNLSEDAPGAGPSGSPPRAEISEDSFEVDTSSSPSSSGREEGKQINMTVIIAAAVLLAAVVGVIVFLRLGIKSDKDKGAAAEAEESPEEGGAKTEASTAAASSVTSEESPVFDESGETTAASMEPASTPALEDFAWVDNGLPEDVTSYEDINKTEGRWKCMLHAITSTNGRGRIYRLHLHDKTLRAVGIKLSKFTICSL